MTIEDFDKRYDEAQRFLIILEVQAGNDVLSHFTETQVAALAQGANATLAFLRECAQSKREQLQGEHFLRGIGDWFKTGSQPPAGMRVIDAEKEQNT